MSFQLIFCVESNRRAATDNIYIGETLKRAFKIDNTIKISYVNMGSRSKYKDKGVLREIREKIKQYKHGDSYVIYCIDTDQFEINAEQKRQYEDIQRFVYEQNYDLIWFCHDVEEVYLEKTIQDGEKKERAVEFVKRREIDKVDMRRLCAAKEKKSHSNIINVIGKYVEAVI